jgi:hypothetical protein
MPVSKPIKHMDKEHVGHGHHGMCGRAGKQILMTLVGILIAYSIVFVATLIRNNIQKFYYIGKADKQERMITVSGQGKITATPDVAVMTMGMVSNKETVADAQKVNTETMNKLLARLKELGVDSKDIQTQNYNIYPQYDYTDKDGRVLKGYEVSQDVSIKIRDLTKTSKVVALAGEVGANVVNGLAFTIDNPETFKDKAREEAIKNVGEKQLQLARFLGVRFIDIVSYNEYSPDSNPSPMYEAKAIGMGGGAPSPTVEAGSQDIVLNVDVTFSVK